MSVFNNKIIITVNENNGARFPPLPKYYTIHDPGAYQGDVSRKKQNVVPFLSNTPRSKQGDIKLWTHAVYNYNLPHRIPNCSAMLSKTPRFPYEAFSAKDLEEILCKCGITNPCECPTGQEVNKIVICQGKVKKRIFKGPTPRSVLGDEGLSAPSRKDHGFEIRNGVQRRLMEKIKEECPPFYDARVNEATAFYQGCKWSKRTSSKVHKVSGIIPGPGDYIFEPEPTEYNICIEKIRAYKKRIAKQLRYMDLVYEKNLSEDSPGPTTYDPKEPKGTDLSFIGSKAKRFAVSKYKISPGPADHWLRRDFDAVESTGIKCHAKLPAPPCFGSKSGRFSKISNDGPGPATYDTRKKLCTHVHCSNAPFGTSAKRFKQEVEEESYFSEPESLEYIPEEGEHIVKPCIPRTWVFKSKTIRMKPLLKKYDEPSPADLPQNTIEIKRSPESQYVAPFFSSEGRFLSWYDWMPVHGKMQTPGPATYCLAKPKCLPAFNHGPLYRAERFPKIAQRAPAPNRYDINYCGIESILSTHNERLKNNIKNKYKFHWEVPKPKKVLNFEEKEDLLFQHAINSLYLEDEVLNEKLVKEEKLEPNPASTSKTHTKPKMLRSFLYAHPSPQYF